MALSSYYLFFENYCTLCYTNKIGLPEKTCILMQNVSKYIYLLFLVTLRKASDGQRVLMTSETAE